MIAPRPCVWEAGLHDSLVKPDWAENALARITRTYRALDAVDKLEVDRFEGGHKWSGRLGFPMLERILA